MRFPFPAPQRQLTRGPVACAPRGRAQLGFTVADGRRAVAADMAKRTHVLVVSPERKVAARHEYPGFIGARGRELPARLPASRYRPQAGTSSS